MPSTGRLGAGVPKSHVAIRRTVIVPHCTGNVKHGLLRVEILQLPGIRPLRDRGFGASRPTAPAPSPRLRVRG
jgi:hypothetical protein